MVGAEEGLQVLAGTAPNLGELVRIDTGTGRIWIEEVHFSKALSGTNPSDDGSNAVSLRVDFKESGDDVVEGILSFSFYDDVLLRLNGEKVSVIAKQAPVIFSESRNDAECR